MGGRTYGEYLERAHKALAAGFTTKQARKDALYWVSHAFDIVREELHKDILALRDRGELRDGSEAFSKLYYGVPSTPAHWNTKRAKQFERFPDLVKLADQCAKLRGDIVAAPTMPKPVSEREKKLAVDAAKAMHCQVCGRAILAELGTIALHGYQRPGTGWQTQSCYGAKRLPYEAARDAVEELCPAAARHVADLIKVRKDVAAERIPVTRYAAVYDRGLGHKPRSVAVDFTRETLPYALYFAPSAFDGQHVKPNGKLYSYEKHKEVDAFEHFKGIELASCARDIQHARDWLKYLENRRDTWPGVTHAFAGRSKGWVAKSA